MDVIVEQKYSKDDKAFYAHESGNKTYFMLVKVDDLEKIEKLVDDTFKVYYSVFIYSKNANTEAPVLAKMVIEESKLIAPDVFVDTIVTTF